jgi:ubiquinone/menaquinone biosynthesis C-methylase UbiE
MKHFDKLAKDWDLNDMKTQRAKAVAKEIKLFFKDNPSQSALEFGCGTGLLSFELKDFFSEIILMDSSKGMIEVLEEKISTGNIQHFTPLHIDLLNEDYHAKPVDTIYSKMTFHHILDLDLIISKLKALLKSNGHLCIIDLDKEDGSFHSEHPDFVGHLGFDREELKTIFLEHGFSFEYENTCFEIKKEDTGKVYPLFIMIFKKFN